MINWNDKSTNSIITEIQHMKQKHEAIKQEMLRLYDEMIVIEKNFAEANKVIDERLKGKVNEQL